MSIKPKRNYRNFLIHPQYQWKYVFWLSATGLALVIMNALIFYHFVGENYRTLVAMAPMTDDVRNQLVRELSQIIIVLSISAVAFLGFAFLFGIVFSHRTAGPMYRLKKTFQEVAEGNLESRIQLRPGDDFHDVADAFNQMMDKVSYRTKGW